MVKGRKALAEEPYCSYLDLGLKLHACLILLDKQWQDIRVTIYCARHAPLSSKLTMPQKIRARVGSRLRKKTAQGKIDIA
jgi:hypothetical protein